MAAMEDLSLAAFLESEKFVQASANSPRLISKLKSALEREEFYEINQIVRTIYFRFSSSKDKIDALEELLFQVTCYLIKHNENISALDIASLFLEIAAKRLLFYREGGSERADEDLTNPSLKYHIEHSTLDLDISSKVALIATGLPNIQIGRIKFTAEALKTLTTRHVNTVILHEALASGYLKCKQYADSRYHYLRCANMDNADTIGRLLADQYQALHSDTGTVKVEADLFVTQFILQYLCLQRPLDNPTGSASLNKKKNSSEVFIIQRTRTNIKNIGEKILLAAKPCLGQAGSSSHTSPLLNFTYFIVSIIDGSNEASVFTQLCSAYEAAWMRDPTFKKYLDRIGYLYFGICDKANQHQGGFLNSIFQSLLDGQDGEEARGSTQTFNNSSSGEELD